MRTLKNGIARIAPSEPRYGINGWPRKSVAERVSPFSTILLTYLIVGVPVLFAAYTLAEREQSKLLIFPVFLLFVLIAVLNLKKSINYSVHRFYYLFFLVLLLATIFALTQRDRGTLYSQFASLVMCFMWSSVFISIYFLVKTPKQYRFAARLVDKMGVVIALSVFMSYIGPNYLGFSFGEFIHDATDIRGFGPFGDQVGYTLGYFALRSLVHKKWFSVALHSSAILFTGTRGAVVSVTIGVFWLIIQGLNKRHDHPKYRYRIILMSIWAMAAALIFLSTPYGETTLNRFADIQMNYGSLYHRMRAIMLGLQVYLDNPLTGVGYLGFNQLAYAYGFGRYFTTESTLERGTYTAQNQYVQTATDAGTLGLLLLLLLLWSLHRELQRGRSSAALPFKSELLSFSAWLIALAIGNQAAVWILPSAITGYFFFLLAGLSLSLVRMEEQGFVFYYLKQTANRSTKNPHVN
jgi:O-antigen ligase